MQFKYESNTTQATKFPILAQSNSVYEPLGFIGENLVYPRSYKLFNAPERQFGTVNSFTLEMDSDDTEIYFNRPNGGYELVLVKDEETGEWIRPRK